VNELVSNSNNHSVSKVIIMV